MKEGEHLGLRTESVHDVDPVNKDCFWAPLPTLAFFFPSNYAVTSVVRVSTGVSHSHIHWTMFIDHLFQARPSAVPLTDRASLMAQQIKNLPAVQETQETRVQSLGWEDLLGKRTATTPVFLPEKSRGQRNPAGYSPMGHRVRHNWATKHSTAYCSPINRQRG